MSSSSPNAAQQNPSSSAAPATQNYWSVSYVEMSNTIVERVPNRIFRPVFVNGVEVGYAYAHGPYKKLDAHGITIALWYFISRGHQAQALLPFCYKNHPTKLDGWDELMSLYRMNLIEFTPGYGYEKYPEVNRIIATRARQYGGCIVACSQMRNIVKRNPILNRTVENKLLIPTFNGEDLIFPIDGPLGRNGNTLTDTLLCSRGHGEWSRCAMQQMSLCDQRIWMLNIANVSQKPQWKAIAELVSQYQPRDFVTFNAGKPPFGLKPLELHPPETNPLRNRGFSTDRFTDNGHQTYHQQHDGSYYKSDCLDRRRDTWTRSHKTTVKDGLEKPYQNKPKCIGLPSSIYRLEPRGSKNLETMHIHPTNEAYLQATNFKQLAEVFGNDKAKAVCDRNPDLAAKKSALNKLADLALEENVEELKAKDEKTEQKKWKNS